jgi:hypothetical protein
MERGTGNNMFPYDIAGAISSPSFHIKKTVRVWIKQLEGAKINWEEK